MTKQIRQTKMYFNEITKEYQVKLFIDGVHQPGEDYFTDDLIETQWAIVNMEAEPKPQEDFCKVEEKKQKLNMEKTDWPIHDESGELIGWLELAEDKQMPQVLCIQNKAYVQTNLSRIAC